MSDYLVFTLRYLLIIILFCLSSEVYSNPHSDVDLLYHTNTKDALAEIEKILISDNSSEAERVLAKNVKARIQLDQGAYDLGRPQLFEALKLSKELSSEKYTFYILLDIGRYYIDIGIKDTAYNYLMEASNLASKENNQEMMAESDLSLVQYYYRISQFEKFNEHLFKAEEMNKEIKSPTIEMKCASYLGTSFTLTQDYEGALRRKFEYLKLATKLERLCDIQLANFQISITYSYMGDYEKQRKFLKEALDVPDFQVCGKLYKMDMVNSMGGNCFFFGKYDSAAYYFEQALTIAREQKMDRAIGTIISNLMTVNLNTGNYKRIFELKEVATQTEEFKTSTYLQHAIYNTLYEAHSDLSQFEEAYKYAKMSIAVVDSMHTERLDKKVLELQTKYESEKKDIELQLKEERIATQEVRNKNLQLTVWAALASLLLLVIISGTYIQRNRQLKAMQSSLVSEIQSLNALLSQKESIVEETKIKSVSEQPIEGVSTTSKQEFQDMLIAKYALTSRELEVWRYLSNGIIEREMPDIMFIDITTIRSHRKKLYKKLHNVSGRSIGSSNKAIVLYRDELIQFSKSKSEMLVILSTDPKL